MEREDQGTIKERGRRDWEHRGGMGETEGTREGVRDWEIRSESWRERENKYRRVQEER